MSDYKFDEPIDLLPFPSQEWSYEFSEYYNQTQMIKHLNHIFPDIYQKFSKAAMEKILSNTKSLTKEEIQQCQEFAYIIKKLSEGKELGKDTKFSQISERVVELIFEIGTAVNFRIQTAQFLREMSLVYLIVIFEEFLKKILWAIFEQYPQEVKSDKTMSYNQLAKLTNSDIKDMVLSHEVNRLVDGGIKEWSKKLGDWNYNPRNEDGWTEFEECFYRRNIIVHNGGMMDEKYIDVTQYGGEPKRVETDKEYIDRSVTFFQKFGVQLMNFYITKYCKTSK